MMRVPIDDMVDISNAVRKLGTLMTTEFELIEITQFKYKNHTVYLSRDGDGKYDIRGIDTKEESSTIKLGGKR